MTGYLQALIRVLGRNEYRQVGNLLPNPAFQLKLPLYVLLLTSGFLATACWLGWRYFEPVVVLVQTGDVAGLEAMMHVQLQEFFLVMALLLAVYAALVAFSCTLFSHRVVGPVQPLCRHIRALRDGLYSHRVRLRHSDGLHEVAAALNQLAESLEKRF